MFCYITQPHGIHFRNFPLLYYSVWFNSLVLSGEGGGSGWKKFALIWFQLAVSMCFSKIRKSSLHLLCTKF